MTFKRVLSLLPVVSSMLSHFTCAATIITEEQRPHLRRPKENSTITAGRRDLQGQFSIDELVQQNRHLGQLRYFLVEGGIPNYFKDNQGPVTLFAPWNQALDQLDMDIQEKFHTHAWYVHLENFLLHHVYLGDLSIESLQESREIVMANHETVVVTRQPGTSRVHAENVLALANYDATDGHAYMLDKVLRPAWFDRMLLDYIASTPSLSTIANWIELAGLQDTVNQPRNGITILAPDDSAFEAMDYMDRGRLLRNPAILRDTVLYHMIPFTLPAGCLANDADPPVETKLVGKMLDLIISDPSKPPIIAGEVNQASIFVADQPSYNGIVHVIDTVLLLAQEE